MISFVAFRFAKKRYSHRRIDRTFRRAKGNHRTLLFSFVAIFTLLCSQSQAVETKPLNIVLIFADDLGWQETGFSGSDFLETPRLDQLAAEGLVFRHAYAIFSISKAACEFIEANHERPFFAYIPHYAVHSRLEGRAGTLARYKSKSPGKLGHDHPLLAACLSDMELLVWMTQTQAILPQNANPAYEPKASAKDGNKKGMGK